MRPDGGGRAEVENRTCGSGGTWMLVPEGVLGDRVTVQEM